MNQLQPTTLEFIRLKAKKIEILAQMKAEAKHVLRLSHMARDCQNAIDALCRIRDARINKH